MTLKLESQRALATQRDVRLKQIAKASPFIAGSLAKMGVKCSNPTCKCASGERHEAWVLPRKEQVRTVTVHVPRDMVAEGDRVTRPAVRPPRQTLPLTAHRQSGAPTSAKAGQRSCHRRCAVTRNGYSSAQARLFL